MFSNKGSDSEMPQAREEYDPPTPKSGMPVKEETKKPSAAPKRRLESKSPSHKGEPPQKAQKKGSQAQEDHIDDVPALIRRFEQTGGYVPLNVHVAEVEALQQGATRRGAAAVPVAWVAGFIEGSRGTGPAAIGVSAGQDSGTYHGRIP